MILTESTLYYLHLLPSITKWSNCLFTLGLSISNFLDTIIWQNPLFIICICYLQSLNWSNYLFTLGLSISNFIGCVKLIHELFCAYYYIHFCNICLTSDESHHTVLYWCVYNMLYIFLYKFLFAYYICMNTSLWLVNVMDIMNNQYMLTWIGVKEQFWNL